jgi:phosphatidylserine/phosphatidylglycerophosphate/cardiolipin synthase-like enzyme
MILNAASSTDKKLSGLSNRKSSSNGRAEIKNTEKSPDTTDQFDQSKTKTDKAAEDNDKLRQLKNKKRTPRDEYSEFPLVSSNSTIKADDLKAFESKDFVITRDGEEYVPTNKYDTHKTTITPLLTGSSIFPVVRNMIRQAEDNIAIEMYTFSNKKLSGWDNAPGVTNAQYFKDHEAIVDELIDASKRGVKVQVILDSSKGYKGRINNQEVADHLTKHGVEVIRFPAKEVNMNHVKLLVVDDNRAMIGGMNWGVHSPVNRDANVLITGREAAELKAEIFDPAVRFATKKDVPKTIPHPDREDKIQVLTNTPVEMEGGSGIREPLLDLIDNAKKDIRVELYCLTDKPVVKSLINAHKRGVDVKIILDPNMYLINRHAFKDLIEAGVPTRWYKVNVDKKEKFHNKWATFDGEEMIIGSANWSFVGLVKGEPGKRTNREANIKISDQKITNRFQERFLRDWDNSQKKLPPADRYTF